MTYVIVEPRGLAQASPCENLLSAVEFETELLISTQLVWGRGEL